MRPAPSRPVEAADLAHENDPIEALARLTIAWEALASERRDLVKAARESGASWESLGRVLGMTGEGARRKFGGAS